MTESTSWVARMQGDGDVRFSIVVAVTRPCRSVGVRHGLRSAQWPLLSAAWAAVNHTQMFKTRELWKGTWQCLLFLLKSL